MEYEGVESISYATSNENGQQEVEIVYEKSLWRNIFNMDNRVERFVFNDHEWMDKDNGNPAPYLKLCMIVDIMSAEQGVSQ